MPLIGEKDADFIRDHFSKHMTGEVKITLFSQRESPLYVPSQECMYCSETRELLQEVAELNDNIKLHIKDFVTDQAEAASLGIDHIPAFLVEGAAKGKVRFFGIPSGYEFATLIEDIVDVSRGETDLQPKTKEALAALTDDIRIQVFTTPT